MKTSDAQLRASAKYKAKHKEQQRMYVAKSTAKRFIREFATAKDLEELKQLIAERESELNKQ